MHSVPYRHPSHSPQASAYLQSLREVLCKSEYIHGDLSHAFHQLFSKNYGFKTSLAVDSKSKAFREFLKKLDLKVGSSIPCSAYIEPTYVMEMLSLDLKPQFVDLDPRTFQISKTQLKQNLSPQTSLLVLNHVFGIPSFTEGTPTLCKKYNTEIFEFVPTGFSNKHHQKTLGTLGNYALLHMHPQHLLRSSEAGFFVSKDKSFSLHTQRDSEPTSKQDFETAGSLSEFYAGLGIWMLKNEAALHTQNLKIFTAYVKQLEPLKNIYLSHIKNNPNNGGSHFVILIQNDKRDRAYYSLLEAGIAVKRPFTPAPFNSLINITLRPSQLPGALKIYEEALLLPVNSDITKSEVTLIKNILKEAIL